MSLLLIQWNSSIVKVLSIIRIIRGDFSSRDGCDFVGVTRDSHALKHE